MHPQLLHPGSLRGWFLDSDRFTYRVSKFYIVSLVSYIIKLSSFFKSSSWKNISSRSSRNNNRNTASSLVGAGETRYGRDRPLQITYKTKKTTRDGLFKKKTTVMDCGSFQRNPG